MNVTGELCSRLMIGTIFWIPYEGKGKLNVLQKMWNR